MINLEMRKEDYGKSLMYVVVPGFIIGFVLQCFYIITSSVLPKSITSVLIVTIYCIITGAIHIDGLGDTFDGLFSQKPKEKILLIMKDSRMGTYGILAILLIIILNIVIIFEINLTSSYLLLIYPISGRTAILVCAGISDYAGKEDGLAKNFVEYCKIKEVIIGSILYLIIITLVMRLDGLVLGICLIIFSYIFTRLISKKLNGVTGDILGAVCEVSQIAFMLASYLVLN
jgi:adenosylcobinamide-GDP ribazoletransferase